MSVVRVTALSAAIAVILSGCGGSSSSPPAGPFSIGGTVSGLAGTGLVLNDGTEDLAVAANGRFTFPTKLATGTAYAVTVKAQPSAPPQTCTVTGGAGTVASADVTGVTVSCATNRYQVGGAVSGLAGSGLRLRNNGGDEIELAPGATSFAFPARVESGGAYAVTVSAQPTSPSQSCAVTGGSGTVGAADVTSVSVTCQTSTFLVKGTLAGLAGGNVALRLAVGAASDNLTLAANGAFAFSTLAPSGQPFVVTVTAQPATPPQVCSVAPSSGTVAAQDVELQVVCSTSAFHVGGTVTGLQGTGLVLANNGGDDLPVGGNGSFTFPTRIARGARYDVSVKAKAGNPSQTCAIANGSGVIGDADVTNVQVTCSVDAFAVGGTVTGLSGTLVLQNNGGNDLTVTANGPFAFTVPVASGGSYDVRIRTQPASPVAQTCTVSNGTGTVGAAPVTSVAVSCESNKFPVGGTVAGLASGATLVLRNNGGDDLTVTGTGAASLPFAFPALLDSGAAYAVTVLASPTSPVSQACTVASGSGTVGAAPVTTVRVTCTTNTFTVGGTLTGLASGQSVVLQDNLGDDLTLAANGSFTFATAVASGAAYSVTVRTQPSTPVAQTCTVTGGSGTVGAAAVTNVQVTCAARTFTVGGTLTGLDASSSVVLQNNAGDDLTLSANGSFTFATGVASGQAYAVTVLTNPSSPVSQACTVTAGSGTVAGADVSTVQVSCVTNTFTVGGTLSGLAASSSVVLRNNGADDLTLGADGAFTFGTAVASGQPFAVTVLTQPATQVCSVTNGSGTVGAANLTNVQVACVTQTVVQRWAAPDTWGGTAPTAGSRNGFWQDGEAGMVQHAVFTSAGIQDGYLSWETAPAGVDFRAFTGFGPGLTRYGAGFSGTTAAMRTTPFADPAQNPLNLTGNMIACAVIKPDFNPVWGDQERVIFASGIEGESGWVLMQMYEDWCFHYQGLTSTVDPYMGNGGRMNYVRTWFNSLDPTRGTDVNWSQTGPLNGSYVVVCGGRDDSAGPGAGKLVVAANNFTDSAMADVAIGEPMVLSPHPVVMGNYDPLNPAGSWRNNWNGRVYETAVWNLPATRENVQAKMNAVLGVAAMADGSLATYRRDSEAPFAGPEATPAYHTASRHVPRLNASRGLLFGVQGVNHVPWPESMNWWVATPGAGGAPTILPDPTALPFPPGDGELRTGDLVTLPAGARISLTVDPFFNPGRLQGQVWLIRQAGGTGTLTIRSERVVTPVAPPSTPVVTSSGSQTVSIAGLSATAWTRQPLTALSAAPAPSPPDPLNTYSQTLVFENAGGSPITFGVWGVSLTQISPDMTSGYDLGIANYDTLLGSTMTEYLAFPALPAAQDPLAGGVCLAATATAANETPWNAGFHRPRALVTLQRTDSGTGLQSYVKLAMLGGAGGVQSDQRLCLYVNDGTTSTPVCTAADSLVTWDSPTPQERTVKGCLSSTGQVRLYVGNTQVATGTAPVVPSFQGGQVLVGSNETGTHPWSGYIRSAAVCRDDGNLASCQ